MRNKILIRNKFNIILSIITCILFFSSTANATIIGAIQNTIPQSDGSLIVNGWACDTTKKSDVWLEIFPGIRGTSGVSRISWGGTQVNSPTGTSSSCIDPTSGFSYRVSSANVSQFSGKSLWGYIMVNGIPTQMGNSGSYIIRDDGNSSSSDNQNQYSSFSLSQLQSINTSNTGPQVNLNNLVHSGEIKSAFDGEVIEGLNIDGNVTINKNNVTLQNCKVKGTVTIREGVTGTIIKNCTIDAKFQYRGILISGNDTNIEFVEIKNAISAGIALWVSTNKTLQATNTHIKRVNIFDSTDGILSRPHAAGNNPVTNLLIEESYIHDSFTRTKAKNALQNLPVGTPAAIKKALQNSAFGAQNKLPHVDGIQISGNKNVLIRNNRISIPIDQNEVAPTAPIYIKPDAFFDKNIIAVGNLVSGGASSLSTVKNKNPVLDVLNILITDNFLTQGQWVHRPIRVSNTLGDLDCIVLNTNKNTSGEELWPFTNQEESGYIESIEDESCFVGTSGWTGWPSNWPVE